MTSISEEEWGIRLEQSIFNEGGIDVIANKILEEFKKSVFIETQENREGILSEFVRCKKILGFTPSTTLLVKEIENFIQVIENKKGTSVEELMRSLLEKCSSLQKDEEKNKKSATRWALRSIEKAKIIGVGSPERKEFIKEIVKELNKDWKVESLPLRKSESFNPPKELIICYNEEKREIGSLYELCIDHVQEAAYVFIGVHSFSKEGVIAEKRFLPIARAAKEKGIPLSAITQRAQYCSSPGYILRDMATNSPFGKFWDFIPAELIKDIAVENGIFSLQEISL